MTTASSLGSSNVNCRNCDTLLVGKFCHFCGQAKFNQHELRIKHFLLHALHELTHVDSKIWRSLRDLVFKPGQLTAMYWAGKKSHYMQPLQLFIVMNVFYFIFADVLTNMNNDFSVQNVFAVPLKIQIEHFFYGGLAQNLVTHKLAVLQISADVYEKQFNALQNVIAKSFIFTMIPLFAFGMQLVSLKSRRYYVEHLIFSTHFFSFVLVFFSTLPFIFVSCMLAISYLFGIDKEHVLKELYLSLLVFGMIFLYLTVAVRRTYLQPYHYAMGLTILLSASLLFILNIYRFLLFILSYLLLNPHP